ncbi:MAG: cupin domain-containing protein, partial [Calditrichaeota bacterium]|nr:cupin domain-containing protein [Calditrichota bacterium]
MKLSESSAAIVLKSIDLNKDIHFFETLGFRILSIFPADQPRIAELNGHGLRIKLDRSAKNVNAEIQIKPNQPSQFDKTEYTSPTGTAIQIVSDQQKISETTAKTIVVSSPEKDGWHVGRAGMLYRDLIPDRLNGRIIASHIRIPEGGPVPDRVHYHTVDFQLIYCLSGWVKVVYEDQGDPLILETGDFVTQPPEIRHRVLES